MEIIYTGNEPMLTDLLIEKAISEKHVDVFKIKEIYIDCFMPDNKMHLWRIEISIRADYTWSCDFYSKNCIHHGYSITYLQHLRNMGVKKLKLDKLENKGE